MRLDYENVAFASVSCVLTLNMLLWHWFRAFRLFKCCCGIGFVRLDSEDDVDIGFVRLDHEHVAAASCVSTLKMLLWLWNREDRSRQTLRTAAFYTSIARKR